MPKKLSCKQINAFIQDEKSAVVEYNNAGYPRLAADERRHQKFFEHRARKACK